MDALIQNFFNPAIMRAAAPLLLKGLGMTVLLCLVVVPAGVAGGLGVALLSTVRRAWVRWPLIVYVDFFRAFPPLVLLIFIFFGLPFLGLDLPAFAAVVIAFLLNTSSYYGEILRAGIESVGSGQTEAARSTGLGRVQTLAYVVVPQAVRNVLPDLIGNTLEVVKLTSLASVVALPELLYAARSAQSVTYNPSPIVLAAAVYFVLLWPGVRLLSRLEHRMLASRR
ncbi:MAG: polar amino acid ABC transporter permease [Candidatus Rokubacteria bacterium RIFCSPHIGHO2_12_FULL_73_22]|nr:MAG: polar amino acid ABC transporter permease [Candidatus Rokubacteria bacterium RIFCSPHIGHO2_02_FULL_73_26]OGL00922.1 MAG: polar amino acid ABC transporter permease [Candidatus Rokubacteria bacterium RIFCSPHIGHO2_12_FULL_73_22]OGL28206.1 MAG: polar amino acid ABC transporter permease [Candidatus Rokubacteria bacterium RIFCSPLOWO2_12_FULL_73_47]